MKKKIIKVISVFMVLNIFLIPLANFAPGNQIKTVQAAEGVVDIRFYNAMVSLIGITAAGIAAMSPSFSIPEVDMIQLKDQFAQSLESDAAKKTAWMNAQADYLSGGVAKTMSAVELAKIGVNDIYQDFKNYLEQNYIFTNADGITVPIDSNYSLKIINNFGQFSGSLPTLDFNYTTTTTIGPLPVSPSIPILGMKYLEVKGFDTINNTYDNACRIVLYTAADSYSSYIYVAIGSPLASNDIRKKVIETFHQYSGINIINSPLYNGAIAGILSNNNTNILNKTDSAISVLPTIPWVDTSIQIGTIVTPAISAPYAGTVPIDVPITVPIDPPIDVPVDPPVEPTLIGTVAAILAGLTPIAGFLEYILAGQVSLTDTIEAGITGVIDGIGDIAGTLTGGITSSLTDIQSSISTLTAPATETINLDPVKNIPKVLFTKFPFSIPWDLYNVYNLMATDNRSPPEFILGIQMSKSSTLSSLGAGDINMEVKLENYEQIAGIIRVGELLLFVLGLIFATKKLIWG